MKTGEMVRPLVFIPEQEKIANPQGTYNYFHENKKKWLSDEALHYLLLWKWYCLVNELLIIMIFVATKNVIIYDWLALNHF